MVDSTNDPAAPQWIKFRALVVLNASEPSVQRARTHLMTIFVGQPLNYSLVDVLHQVLVVGIVTTTANDGLVVDTGHSLHISESSH